MKLSIVIAVLDSHEIVRRQALYWKKMPLPDDVEVILVDDGSDPPILASDLGTDRPSRLAIYATHNPVPWSEHAARNKGVRHAQGDYVFLIDIDYIITAEAISMAMTFDGVRMDIQRRLGVLDASGCIDVTSNALKQWQVRDKHLTDEVIPGHRSQFLIRKDVFWALGGYREDLAGQNHPLGGGPGQKFHGKWRKWKNKYGIMMSDRKLPVYMFPSGKWCVGNHPNPSGLFHGLERVA